MARRDARRAAFRPTSPIRVRTSPLAGQHRASSSAFAGSPPRSSDSHLKVRSFRSCYPRPCRTFENRRTCHRKSTPHRVLHAIRRNSLVKAAAGDSPAPSSRLVCGSRHTCVHRFASGPASLRPTSCRFEGRGAPAHAEFSTPCGQRVPFVVHSRGLSSPSTTSGPSLDARAAHRCAFHRADEKRRYLIAFL